MQYEKSETVSLRANAAFAAGDIGKAVKVVRSGTDGRVALVSATTDVVVGVLAQDGPFAAGDVVPVMLLTGKIPARCAAAMVPGQIANVSASGEFTPAGNLAGVTGDGMAAGVCEIGAAAGGIALLVAFPTYKS